MSIFRYIIGKAGMLLSDLWQKVPRFVLYFFSSDAMIFSISIPFLAAFGSWSSAFEETFVENEM